jgi:tRNA-dihydrouridine synthase B
VTSRPALTEPWELAGLRLPNRVLLAPLAGIGNWFVRLQAARHGAGMAYSEMVSSFAIHYGNERTLTELLRVHPDEGPTALQLFGQDPEVMKSAAAYVAEHVPQVDVIDLNMGCPVPKVCKTGAGAAMLKDPDTAVAVARAAREGSGKPVTVKLRSGSVPGDRTSGIELSHRLVEEAGVSAITFHPRSAKVHHKGVPDYDLAAELVASLPVPVILTGGLQSVEEVQAAYEHTGAAAVMLARGCSSSSSACAPATPRPTRSLPNGTGSSTAPKSTSDRSAAAATCASSTPGTSSASTPARTCTPRCSRRTPSTKPARRSTPTPPRCRPPEPTPSPRRAPVL